MQYDFVELEQRTIETTIISQSAISFIDTTYGNKQLNNDAKLAYHNGLHTRNVIEDFARLAMSAHIDTAHFAVGILAASAHDLVQLHGVHANEVESADWLEARMLKSQNFTKNDVEVGRLAILGTVPIFDGGHMVGQLATQLEFPTKKHELVAHLVASADLGRLYSSDGPYLAHLLYKELNEGKTPINLHELLDFQRYQITFLESYRYPYEAANQSLTTHKKQVMQYAAQVVLDIESGKLETWNQLLRQDFEFMQSL